ncbi:MAG: Gp15 family bacteriophage protein [Angelakisella sp.]
MITWRLPETAEIGGQQYRINADFRDVLEVIARLQNTEEPEQERMYIALALFYDDFDQIPGEHWQAAAEYLCDFINLGEHEQDSRPAPKRIDWEQDYQMIAAEVNKSAGFEVRSVPFLHWWTFIGYFHTVGDGQLATVCSIREKRRKGKKLEQWEQEYYRENKAKIDLKATYSAEEQEELEELKKILGE